MDERQNNSNLLRALANSGSLDSKIPSDFEVIGTTVPASFDRVRGMMLGLAIGDALGNTSEGMTRGLRRRVHGEIADYLPNRKAGGERVGLPSDDTQMAFWTLEHLLEKEGLVPEGLANTFASAEIFGRGSTVRQFQINHASDKPWHECGPKSAGNGALMRIAPVLVPLLSGGEVDLTADTVLCSMITHNDSASIASCVAFVAMLGKLTAMKAPPSSQWWLTEFLDVARELENDSTYRPRGGEYFGYGGKLSDFAELVITKAVNDKADTGDACDSWYSGAYLLETVPSALYILMKHGHDPEEAIIRAVNDTKDNDTIGAIVGAAVGALHGADRLPERWVEGLLGRLSFDDDGRVFELLDLTERKWFSS